jgi:hypothetical protein
MTFGTLMGDTAIRRARVLPRDPERRIRRLIDRLPARLQTTAQWLRRPSSRWARLPAGVLLVAGSALSVLPVFGLWMLPLGLLLLAEDVPAARRVTDRLLDCIERRRPDWLGATNHEA